jgi:peptidoglycan/LPS O-acetylase OafA/YrhL
MCKRRQGRVAFRLVVANTNHVFPVDKKDRVFGLDILRAAAILMVLIGHTWPSKAPNPWPGTLAFLGVELFFVLSGFLIGGILIRLADTGRLHKLADVSAFWRRRWFRTLPNYYLFLGLHLAWRTWELGFPDQIRTNWEYLFFVQNVWHPPTFFFNETWSLAIEEWFYFLFPLLLFVALRLLRKPIFAWAAIIALFIIIPTALRLPYLPKTTPVTPEDLEASLRMWDSMVRKIVIVRLDVVMYGVIGALVAAWKPQQWLRMRALWIVGAAFICVSGASILIHRPLHPGIPWHGFVLWPLISLGFALILPLFSQIPAGFGWPGRVISWVAKISYALYLCHGLVILVLTRWFGPRDPFPLPKHTFLWCVVAWIISFTIAHLVYRWFEKPFMDLRDRYEKPRSRPEIPTTPQTTTISPSH